MKFSPGMVDGGRHNNQDFANFLYNNIGGYRNPANGHIPDGTPVLFITTLGQVRSQQITKYTINSVATAILRVWNAA